MRSAPREPRRHKPRVSILDLEVNRAEQWAYLIADREDLRRALKELAGSKDDHVGRKRDAVLDALDIRFDWRPDA